MNKQKGLLYTLSLTLCLFVALVTLLTHTPPPVHAFAGDYALEFNDSDLVNLPQTNVVMNNPDWVNNKTISLWVKPTGTAYCNVPADYARCDHVFGDRPRWWGISRGLIGGQDRIWIWNYDGNFDVVGIPYTVGEWVHISMVHGGGQLAAYKNGVLVGQVPSGATGQPPANPVLQIGGTIIDQTTGNYTFQGQIDEVQIWTVARTGAQIRQDMHRTLSPQAGLAAYYQMSNGSGTTLTDNSGNGHHGTLLDGANNSPPYPGTDGIPPQWVASGAFAGPRNALAFDGVNDYVALNVNAETILGSSWASAKTSELWAYPTGTAPTAVSAAAGDILIGNAYWGIARADIGGEDRLWLYNNDGDEDRLGIPYSNSEWTHIVLTHESGNLNAYKNGVLVGSIASGATTADADLLIGSGYEGRLDDLRLWDSARSASAIQENMFRTVAHNESGLAAYYRFDQQNDGSVTTVYDTAVSSHNGTMTNMNPATAWVPSAAFNTWIGSQSSDWADGSNWSRYIAPTVADNAGLYNYPASNAPAISSSSFARSVLIGSGATLTVQTGGSLRADGLWFNLGTLNNNGTLQQEQAVDGIAPVQFFADGNYGPFTIDGAGFNLGATTITVRALANCTTGPEQTVQRCIDIAPTNSPTIGDPGSILTFSFLGSELSSNACNTLNAFHWNGSGWDELTRDSSFGTDGRQCSAEPYALRVTDVTDFSPFMLTSELLPTAVSLQTFSAASTPGVALLLLVGSVFILLTAVAVYGRRSG
ncbi:MAG: LamG domain-containing protein [Anaerolinea sp.]|nr:LamG domain-containing protein [Anaerolinea sp.]